jgi:hypothetical protein
MRQTLIEIANSRRAQDGQGTKMELVYQYLISPRFRHRGEAIVEKFSDMQADLNREKKAMTRLWASLNRPWACMGIYRGLWVKHFRRLRDLSCHYLRGQ